MNILVATPGRLLQHMDETPYFDCSNMTMLILDEADRILDLARVARAAARRRPADACNRASARR